MIELKSKSTKRLIIEGQVNGKAANFLIDTGASVGLIDDTQVKKYGLSIGKRFNGTLVGAGGEMCNIKHCNTFVEVGGKSIPQFLIADIEGVVKSIERETGIKILGIISLPQMKMVGMNVDSNDNLIIIE
jgi:predicted aspartyl protease